MPHKIYKIKLNDKIGGYYIDWHDPWYIRLGRWVFTKIGWLE